MSAERSTPSVPDTLDERVRDAHDRASKWHTLGAEERGGKIVQDLLALCDSLFAIYGEMREEADRMSRFFESAARELEAAERDAYEFENLLLLTAPKSCQAWVRKLVTARRAQSDGTAE